MDNFIKEQSVNLELMGNDKISIFQELISLLSIDDVISDKDIFLKDVQIRESQASTYMGFNIAIPHAKSKVVKQPAIAFGRSKQPITYDDENNEADTFFLLAVPEGSNKEHLEILATLARNLAKEDFRNNLKKANSAKEIVQLLQQALGKASNSPLANHAAIFPTLPPATNKDFYSQVEPKYDFVAITACPVGIAHTYIAAENLTKAAIEQGFTIKVQTNGSIGTKNVLSEADIRNAKAVILAVDLNVDKAQFKGKPIVEVKVKEAVHHAKNVIQQAINIQTSSQANDSNKTVNHTNNNEDFLSTLGKTGGFGFYKDLMTGVSYMIPFIVMGGIFLALSITLSGITPGKGAVITNPFLLEMSKVGVLAFSMIPAILAGFIAFSIAGRPALAPGLVGGLLSGQLHAGFLGGLIIGFVAGYLVKLLIKIPFPKTIQAVVPILFIPVVGGGITAIIMEIIGLPIADLMKVLTNGLMAMQHSNSLLVLYFILGLMIAFDMGGPLNKVAFLFGSLMIVQGVPTIMGAVSVAICIPPLSMGVASTIDRKHYTNEEKVAGKAALFLGLIGITEGAIPFAALDPFRVIPSIMIGSAVGALLGGWFGVSDYAPHGGPIVLPVVDHRLSWILATIIGISVTVVMISILKRIKFARG